MNNGALQKIGVYPYNYDVWGGYAQHLMDHGNEVRHGEIMSIKTIVMSVKELGHSSDSKKSFMA